MKPNVMNRFAPIVLFFSLIVFTGCGVSTTTVGSLAPTETQYLSTAGINEAEPDFNLYGRTIDDDNFNLTSLRGQYVLVKFTATWCGPCAGAIPMMQRFYEQYNDKGLEIVSVYVFQTRPGQDPVATVRNYVAEKGLPWIVLSEELTTRAGLPAQGEAFDIEGVPTFFLLDREGKVIVDATHSVTDIPPVLRNLFGN